MADMWGGAAIGAIFGEALTKALEEIDKACNYKSALEDHTDTLNNLRPLIKEIEEFSKRLGRPTPEVERLSREIREGEELISKCPKPRWSRFWRVFSFPQFHDKLKAREKSLDKSVTIDLQVQMARDVKEILVLLKVREIFESFSKQSYGIQGLSGAPKKPEFTVGLDEPLKNLKVELLKVGFSVHVLTGLGGSGKSTLARKLCWDDEVKGKFGNNIFFMTVSQTPNLKIIVQKLFKNCGLLPEFHNDEEAIDQLGILLRVIGKSPILMVLDDVWPGSESLIQNFKCNIPDYKILVTSKVAFPRFGSQCRLNPLCHEDAEKLFCHFANVEGSDLVSEIVRGCKGLPLALEVIGGSLCRENSEVWQKVKESLQSHSILGSYADLLTLLQISLDLLEHKSPIESSIKFPFKECFKDLGLFPEDQRIPVAALMDIWAELHKLNDYGSDAMFIVNKLANRNLANLLVTRNDDANNSDNYKYYNNHFVMLHDLIRDLAIHLSSEGPFEQRERLIIDINGSNRPQWWTVENQPGITAKILSLLPKWLIYQKQYQVVTRILSISTDEKFTSDWCSMQADETEVLVLNIRSNHYTFLEFMKRMSKLKVLIVTNYGSRLSEINNFELLGFLPNLKRIRLEKVSVPCLCRLKNLKKLSLYMCKTRQAFDSCSIEISDALPNLVEMNIDYCSDLEKLPAGISKMTSLEKLSITNCHNFKMVPQEIGEVENLRELRLSSCCDLKEMPDSIGSLRNLILLDIADCISLTNLPEKFGELHNLEKLCMMGCSRCELPDSVVNLQHLKCLVCDEDTFAAWEPFKPKLPNLKLKVQKADINLDWLPGVFTKRVN